LNLLSFVLFLQLPNDIKETDTSSNSPQPLNSPKNSQYSNKSRSKQISPISHRQHNNANQAVNSQNELDFYSNKPATPYDDRVIPTLRHNSNNPNNINNSKSRMDKPSFDPANNTEEEQIEQQQNSINEAIVPEGGGTDFDQQEMYDPMDGTEEMTESEVREAALMNDYLGKQIVTKLYSKNFQNREDAIQEVFTNLSNYKGEREEAKALMRASAILVAKMSKDNVFSIFNNALKLEQFLLNDFAKRFSIGKQEMNYVLEKCLPVLLHRTGDTNARLRQRAHEFIVEMAMYPEIKPLNTIPLYCIQPIKLHIAPRLALSRVEILEDLMKQLGYKDNGLNVDNISKFCSQALEHTSGEVRELAAKILIQMYRENGQTVRRYLPPDNEMNRRNKKYRILYDAFDGIDGKPIQSYDKVSILFKNLQITTDFIYFNSIQFDFEISLKTQVINRFLPVFWKFVRFINYDKNLLS
jgi:centrosomal protein CEP104